MSAEKPGFGRNLRVSLIVSALIGILLFLYFIPEILVNIGPGEAGIHWKRFFGGTVVDRTYGEGLHLIFPWDEMYIYDRRIQERRVTISALTSEALNATLDISVRFHPEYDLIGMLHQRVGPEYVDRVVIPEAISSVRTVVGTVSAEELYRTSFAVFSSAVSSSMDEVIENFVVINDVVVTRIELPELVQMSIQEKIQQKHFADSFEFRLEAAAKEAERKEIEAGGFANYNRIVNDSLTPDLLKWQGVRATETLGLSENSKVVIIGNDSNELPVILGGDN